MKEYKYKGYKAIKSKKEYEVNLYGYSYYFDTLQAFKDWANHRIKLFAD